MLTCVLPSGTMTGYVSAPAETGSLFCSFQGGLVSFDQLLHLMDGIIGLLLALADLSAIGQHCTVE